MGARIVSEGGKAAILDVYAESADEASGKLRSSGGAAVGIGADVTVPESLEEGFRAVEAEMGAIDGLVTCAGIRQTSAPVSSFPVERWKRVLDVDLFGTFVGDLYA